MLKIFSRIKKISERNFLLSIIIISSLNASAQFLPIANGDSISWKLKHEILDGALIENLYLSDTITIDSNIYYQTMFEFSSIHHDLVGYFREETSSGRAWFWGVNDTSEYLIMDLSLEVGDSIYIKNADYGYQYAKITRIEVENNRRVVSTNYNYGGGFISENVKFIEGIGPNASLLFQVDDYTGSFVNSMFGFLVCKAYNNIDLIYAWDTINYQCGILTNLFDPESENLVQFYPNPANYNLTISGLEHPKTEIFALSGTAYIISEEIEINIEKLKSGIYIIKLYDEGKIKKIDKLIIY